MIPVKATREGLVGSKTSSGYIVDTVTPFAALPSAAALRQWISISYQGKVVRALVLDVGPWNVNDNAYLFQPATEPGSGETWTRANTVRPQSERGLDVSHNGKTNGAGIDLGERTRVLLGIADGLDNVEVSWEFSA